MPYFVKELPKENIYVHLNEDDSYDLPLALDKEGHTILVGCKSIPAFITIREDKYYTTFFIKPTLASTIGSHLLNCYITDGVPNFDKTLFTIKVHVLNESPGLM